jgi:hypothetical protein
MSSKQPIKIIKRCQRERLAEPLQSPECGLKTESQARRDIFETITTWVEEQRETKQSLYRRERLILRGVFE